MFAFDVSGADHVIGRVVQNRDNYFRSRAIELLQPVEGDSSVLEVLHTVASEDDNPHIRTVSREVLDRATEIQ